MRTQNLFLIKTKFARKDKAPIFEKFPKVVKLKDLQCMSEIRMFVNRTCSKSRCNFAYRLGDAPLPDATLKLSEDRMQKCVIQP